MQQTREESISKLKELIEGIDFAMLTTLKGNRMHSRPMSTQKFEFDGDLWFFTSDQTAKVEEIEKDNRKISKEIILLVQKNIPIVQLYL